MNKLVSTFLTLFLLITLQVVAQDKAVEKEWAKKMKLLKPLDYKKLVEDKDALTTQVTECENSKSTLRNDMDTKDSEITRLKKELEETKVALDSVKTATPVATPGTPKTSKTPTKTSGTKPVTKAAAVPGLVYKVQIGSFRNKDLSKYFDNNPNFSGDIDADGSKKYTLGLFSDYWEADNFKKALREMGVKGAWVVPYKDGQRVNIKDVLEGATN